MNPIEPNPRRAAAAADAGVYASFLIGGGEFALDVRHVQEVVNLPAAVAPMPLAPAFVSGVFNLRGAVMPLLDMRRLLDLGDDAPPAGAKVTIVQHRGVRLGLLFDQTRRVLRPRDDERTLFSYEDGSTHGVVAGVLRIGGDLIRVLELERLVSIENVPHAESAAGASLAARAKRAHQRCITFRVGALMLAFEIHGVHEIVPAQGIEPSPVAEPLCAGLLRIRQDLVPVVRFADLLRAGATAPRAAAGAAAATAEAAAAGEERVIVLKLGALHVGLLVDAVEAITAYAEEDLLHVPVLTRQRAAMFAGCLDLGERGPIFLLDSARVMDHDEIARISGQHSALFAARNDQAQAARRSAAMRRTYLWFDALQSFALPMNEVREIIDGGDGLIAMPGAPDFVRGLHNLRGDLVTVVDVRAFYALGEADDATRPERRVVVLEHEGALLGLQVDRVRSIAHVDAANRYPIPLLMRKTLNAATRGDVSEVIQARDERGETAHLLLLDVARIVASVGEREAVAADA
ncbi:MAG: chemotaxis protein CheW [Burkholderiales bacterium]|nr:chemotaxis protein CheW [Burkholderiales bacterium]